MITRLWMKQFKAFESCDIELRPLTVFLGENNSGKSSVLAALRLLAQTVQGPDQTIPLALSAAFGDFGSYRDVVHGNHRGRPITLGLACTDRTASAGRREYSIEVEFKHRTQSRDTFLRSSKLGYIADGRDRSLFMVAATTDTRTLHIESVGGEKIADTARTAVSRGLRMFNFLPRPPLDLPERPSRSVAVNRARLLIHDSFPEVRHAYMAILRALQSVEYLGAMRRPPERTYVNTGVVGKRIGADGSGWPGILALEGSRARPIGTALVSWLRNAGMADSVSVSWLTDRHYEITVTNPMTAETENIADVGQGTSQVLPVIVGGARLRPGDVYIAEEPEIHLHPRAQAALGDYFVGLIKRRVQALVETHSEYLLLRLQQTIARGDLDPADVVFYYIQSNHGRKEVIQLVLDHNAAFRDQIPGGFFPQRVDEARKLAQARGSRAKGPS